jgi:hypothetical protein
VKNQTIKLIQKEEIRLTLLNEGFANHFINKSLIIRDLAFEQRNKRKINFTVIFFI